MRLLILSLLLFSGCSSINLTNPLSNKIEIIDKPIIFEKKRIDLTKKYILTHYGKKVKNIKITPKVVVLHWTGSNDFKKSYSFLKNETLKGREDIKKASPLNVSAHFMVDRDGTIYRLMPENYMARHVIGLNHSSIGIENVGGEDNRENLTDAQIEANIKLIKYLKDKFPTIEYLMGHYQYEHMQQTDLWLEKDRNYRTIKYDPGQMFLHSVRKGVRSLELKRPPTVKAEHEFCL